MGTEQNENCIRLNTITRLLPEEPRLLQTGSDTTMNNISDNTICSNQIAETSSQNGVTDSIETAQQNGLIISIQISNVPSLVPTHNNSQQIVSSADKIIKDPVDASVISEDSVADATTSDITSIPSTSKIDLNRITETHRTMLSDLLIEQNSMYSCNSSELEVEEIPKVNLYAEDNGPKFYDVSENLVSKPIIPSTLSAAFSSLPIFGKPKNKSELPEFQDKKIKEFVSCGLDDSEFGKLADYCSPDNLRTGQELTLLSSPGKGFYPSEMERLNKGNKKFTDEHDLSIVRKHKLRVEKDIKNLYVKRFKYRGIRMMSLGNDSEDNTPVVTIGPPLSPGKELLFFIRWYRPFPYNPKDKNQYRSRHSIFSCNIVMLGRHKLSMLRDRVVCPNDVDMRIDVSDRPDELPKSTAKEMFPSGFLFINNVFYVDTRQGCTDYSLPLRRWAKIRGIGEFQTRDMCDVTLDQLQVKLGHPEVYVHQGNCEHLFTISDIRLVNASDPLKFGAYPCHTALSQNQTIYCTTCAEFGAKWIVVGCPRVPFDPAFFCEKCFKLYLYKDGKKIGDFKAYLYRVNEINVLKPQG